MKFPIILLVFSSILAFISCSLQNSNPSPTLNTLPSASYIFKEKSLNQKREDESQEEDHQQKSSQAQSPSQPSQGNTKEMIKKAVKKSKEKCKGDKECMKIAEKLESDFILLIDKLRKDDVQNEQDCLRCSLKNLVKLYEIDEHMENEEDEGNGEEESGGVHYKKA